MGNILTLESRKRQDIEGLSNYKNALTVLIDLANSMLKTFANEYKIIYGCEVFASHEANDDYKFPFSLKFCEWERLDYPIKKGYLTKQGFVRRSWRRRYFVVRPNYLVDYYENEEAFEKGLKPKGTINPCGYRTVSDVKDEMARRRQKVTALLGADRPDSPEIFPNHTFGVFHDKSRSYFIYADSIEERLEWMEMFQLCCACAKGFNSDDPICQSTFNKAISRTLTAYGNPAYHSYRGTEEKVICDMVTAEIDGRFMAEICKNVKGNIATKMKTRDQVLKDLDTSVMALVVPLWKSLQEEQNEIKLKVSTLIREKEREIAAVRRKVEWEMNGKTGAFLDNALAEVKKSAQKVFPIIEKSMFDALCEVRNIYQKNVVEIGVDVEQREEVEIPMEMYIDSLDMLARTPSEMEPAYQHLKSMEEELTTLQDELKAFDVTAIMLEARETLRLAMDALVNTFQQRFVAESRGIEGKQKHKQLRNLIEEVDDDIANNFENDMTEIMYSFNMKTLKKMFVPFIHKNIDGDCMALVESADNVIPEHLTIVINRNNEYRRLVDKSAEKLLKQVMNPKDEVKQRSFKSSLRNSRRKTFPKFSSRQTKFQDPSKNPNLVRRTSLPVAKTERKASFSNLFACLPIKAEFRDSGVYEGVALDTNGGEDDMQEIKLTLKRGSAPGLGCKT